MDPHLALKFSILIMNFFEGSNLVEFQDVPDYRFLELIEEAPTHAPFNQFFLDLVPNSVLKI